MGNNKQALDAFKNMVQKARMSLNEFTMVINDIIEMDIFDLNEIPHERLEKIRANINLAAAQIDGANYRLGKALAHAEVEAKNIDKKKSAEAKGGSPDKALSLRRDRNS